MGTKTYDSATDLITFTRASGGTALRKISYGNELVTNGDFSSGTTGWVDGTQWSGALDASSGKLLITSDSSNGYGCAIQGVPLVVGKAYRLTGSRRAVSGGNPAIGLSMPSGAVQVILLSGSASTVTNDFSVTFVASSTYSLCLFNQSPTNGNSSEFDNISVKEVLFDQADGTLQLFNHGNNVPRIEYDATTGAVKGLLIEEARTNAISTSEVAQTAYSGGITKSVDSSVVSPVGGNNVEKFTLSSANEHHFFGNHNPISASSGTSTYSIFAKGSGHNLIRLRMANTVGKFFCDFNLSTGQKQVTSGADSSVTGAIESIGNGWWRCSMTYASEKTNPYASVFLINAIDAPHSNPFLGDGTSGVYVWGSQYESGAFPTSYIPTVSSTATRAADVATIPTSAFGYNQKVGSVLFEGKVIKANIGTTIDRRIVEISDGTTTNFISVYQDVSVDQNLRIANADAGVLSVNADTGYTLSDAQTFKVAMGIELNNFAVSVDGGAVVTDTTGTVSNTLSQIDIGKLGGGTQYLNGYIKSIKYYPRRLTNTQLQELTT